MVCTMNWVLVQYQMHKIDKAALGRALELMGSFSFSSLVYNQTDL